MISKQLGVDSTLKSIQVKYTIMGSSTPMEIRNDVGVGVYVELKKELGNFGMYSLCIMTMDKKLEYQEEV